MPSHAVHVDHYPFGSFVTLCDACGQEAATVAFRSVPGAPDGSFCPRCAEDFEHPPYLAWSQADEWWAEEMGEMADYLAREGWF